jgi:DNA-binding MarR family transcriptional regulator
MREGGAIVSDAAAGEPVPPEWFADAGRALSDATIAFHESVAARLGLHITDHKALGALFRSGPLPAGRLAEMMGLTTGSVTAMVDRLERAGYVRRERDPGDRRRVIVVPVADPDRHAEIQALFVHLNRAFAEHLPAYAEAEKRLIVDFMERNVRALRQATAAVRTGDPHG